MHRIVIWHNFFGDLSQGEKLSKIKPPLCFAIDFFKTYELAPLSSCSLQISATNSSSSIWRQNWSSVKFSPSELLLRLIKSPSFKSSKSHFCKKRLCLVWEHVRSKKWDFSRWSKFGSKFVTTLEFCHFSGCGESQVLKIFWSTYCSTFLGINLRWTVLHIYTNRKFTIQKIIIHRFFKCDELASRTSKDLNFILLPSAFTQNLDKNQNL